MERILSFSSDGHFLIHFHFIQQWHPPTASPSLSLTYNDPCTYTNGGRLCNKSLLLDNAVRRQL
jgi:hypothetical protein